MGTVSISHCDMWARIQTPKRVYTTIDFSRYAVFQACYRFKDKSQRMLDFTLRLFFERQGEKSLLVRRGFNVVFGGLLFQIGLWNLFGRPTLFRSPASKQGTMNATCGPGGGPAGDGRNDPRNDPLIQRAGHNGWKKLHGLKWQTVDFPNGMNGRVYGPISLRCNDLTTANWLCINALWVALQENEDFQ